MGPDHSSAAPSPLEGGGHCSGHHRATSGVRSGFLGFQGASGSPRLHAPGEQAQTTLDDAWSRPWLGPGALLHAAKLPPTGRGRGEANGDGAQSRLLPEELRGDRPFLATLPAAPSCLQCLRGAVCTASRPPTPLLPRHLPHLLGEPGPRALPTRAWGPSEGCPPTLWLEWAWRGLGEGWQG